MRRLWWRTWILNIIWTSPVLGNIAFIVLANGRPTPQWYVDFSFIYFVQLVATMLLAVPLVVFSGVRLIRTIHIGRATREYPWQRMHGWYHRWGVRDGQILAGYYGVPAPITSYRSMVYVKTDAGGWMFLRLAERGPMLRQKLRTLTGTEVWVAIGTSGPGAIGLEDGSVLFEVWQEAAGSPLTLESLSVFPLPVSE